MPRPKKDGAPEPKKRSRNGCWPCKARKVKCGEEKPMCLNCKRQGETCDYSIRLNWSGRAKKMSLDADTSDFGSSHAQSPHTSTFSVSTMSPTGPTLQFAQSQYSFPQHHQQSSSRPKSSSIAPLDTSVNQSFSSHASPTLANSAVSPRSAQNGKFQFSPVLSPAQDSLQTQMNKALKAVTSAPVDSRLNAHHRNSSLDFISPTDIKVESDGQSNGTNGSRSNSSGSPPSNMPPPSRNVPIPQDSSVSFQDPFEPPDHRTKRLRLSPTQDTPSPSISSMRSEMLNDRLGPNMYDHSCSPRPGSVTPYGFSTPITPGSSGNSDEGIRPSRRESQHLTSDSEARLSVHALLAGSNGVEGRFDSIHGKSRHHYPMYTAKHTTYGYDIGDPDQDTPRNDDQNAIRQFSPPTSYRSGYDSPGFKDNSIRDNAFEKGGYYAKPVPIKISKELEPLPAKLLDHPMNLLYFHHFINHTARILVPHDCEDNPFRNVLPKLAVRDDILLDLLLAFSASHRARLLGHREPANRIAHWVQHVFPQLRRSIDNTNSTGPSAPVSDSSLTTAIMLVSLEIISPSAFEVQIPWQNHLKLARQMIVARGGLQSIQRRDQVPYFLSRWFAYLDVLGSLSGSKNDHHHPLTSTYWVADGLDSSSSPDDDWRIDCFFGFTTRCVGYLARVAALAKSCEPARFDPTGAIRPNWHPPPAIAAQAHRLLADLHAGKNHVYKGCRHRPSMPHSHSHTPDIVLGLDDDDHHEAGWDALEIFATNTMFHCAGIIHLLRRVLGRPRADAQVQDAIAEIIEKLGRVRKGGTAEACVLFPLFTAGCEALEGVHRERIMDRMINGEGFGMIQVHKARTLMEKVWETGEPWETLVSGEFFG
ncbi:hypothetical protein EJ05DRAFT_511952 [Pseudovirgaria hyperparasitica]|uniref:Zn(2)-C6 fungal-type domain-containing protein n=1 Tax=Pseudovirgaria hyperparasitica TaxID=470096 RepID=A0A6A6W4X6_9PEZI|nr:uncharacterized protein EJ05DRAFT_511952 [Pseudovirgaria hyperparasitica]KAF2757229.1 hypothetical protein EJ05DRAFT_511952 [Pseudovirgaria hyperparasitica]